MESLKNGRKEARNKAVIVAVTKNLVAMKGPHRGFWFLLGVAVKACRDLATLF